MSGIHHVTAIAGNALRNYDFYTRSLGLRFVKKTVNFDDPGTYHFYYGDEADHPGTILTFFPWEGAAAGRGGVGQTQQTAFRVPARSLGYWTHRFIEKGIAHQALEKRFGEAVLPFTDPGLPRRDAVARERHEDQRDSDRCVRVQGDRTRRLDYPLESGQCGRGHR